VAHRGRARRADEHARADGSCLKAISPALSAMPVLLALAATLAATPALHPLAARPAARRNTVC
jgi:hypothetical protein